MLTYRDIKEMGGVAVKVNANLPYPTTTIQVVPHEGSQQVFTINVEYVTPDLDRQIDAAFFAGASAVAAMESGVLQSMCPFFLPDFFPQSLRDQMPEEAELIDRISELIGKLTQKYTSDGSETP